MEPSIAVNPRRPSHIVAAWQQARVSNAASVDIGIAYSKDSGKSWHSSSAHLQICTRFKTASPRKFSNQFQRLSETWLSYSADGKRVYLCNSSLNATREKIAGPHQSGILVNHSDDDGQTWSKTILLASSMTYISEPTRQFANLDKPSITADISEASRVISVWASFYPAASDHGNVFAALSRNAGDHWTDPLLIYDPFPDLVQQKLGNGLFNDCAAQNNAVVTLPGRRWFLFTTRYYARPTATDAQYTSDQFPFQYTLNDIAVVRSHNAGETWDTDSRIAVPSFVNQLIFTGGYKYNAKGDIIAGVGTKMRNDATLPSYAANTRNGHFFVVNQSSVFRTDKLPQVGLTTSRDGGQSWSKLVRVSRTPSDAPNPQAFEAFVAVTAAGRVGVLYFDFRQDNKSTPDRTKMDAWLAIYQEVQEPQGGSTGIGLDFVTELRLSRESYIAQNGAVTTLGVMTDGDYQFLVTHDDTFYAVYTKSTNGPYSPAVQVVPHVFLDNNLRTTPFVSLVKNTKRGAKLLRTTALPIAPIFRDSSKNAGDRDKVTAKVAPRKKNKA